MMDYRITQDGRRLKRVDLETRMIDYSNWAYTKSKIVPQHYTKQEYDNDCFRALQARLLQDPKYRRMIDRCDEEIVWRRDSQEDIINGYTIRLIRASFYIDEAEYIVHILGE